MKHAALILVGGLLVALVLLALFGALVDDALLDHGATFDGLLPPCTVERVGKTTVHQGQRVLCASTLKWIPY